MNEVLLETMIEKLEVLVQSNKEMLTKIEGLPGPSKDLTGFYAQLADIRKEMKYIHGQISESGKGIQKRQDNLARFLEDLQSSQQKVRHIHYLDKAMACCLLLVVVVVGLCVWVGQLYEYIHERERVSVNTEVVMPVGVPGNGTKLNVHQLKTTVNRSKMNTKK
jgi:hypothetical protein